MGQNYKTHIEKTLVLIHFLVILSRNFFFFSSVIRKEIFQRVGIQILHRLVGPIFEPWRVVFFHGTTFVQTDPEK